MKESTYKNLAGRDELIEKLTQKYIEATAEEVTVICGNHGSGKSYVLFEIINKLLNNNSIKNKLQIYMPEDDKLSLYNNPESILPDNVEVSISLPVKWGVSLDIGTALSKKNSDSQLVHIRNLLNSRFTSNILICLPKYSEQHSKIKFLVKLLLSNLMQLKNTFKHSIFFLVTDMNENCAANFIDSSSIEKIFLEDYDEGDIYNYLVKRHNFVLEKEKVEEKLEQIKKTCASNLKLVDFLYVDFVEQDLDFFRALDYIINYRLNQLKKDGLKRNVTEYDMEDIILTSSISLKNFGGQEIALITNKQMDSVRESLKLAHKQVILQRDSSNFYSFICSEIQLAFRKELEKQNKERYLDYYNYYTRHEQDQYYLRAHYLWMYNKKMKGDIFALLMLAYSEARCFNDIHQVQKISSFFSKQDIEYTKNYEQIKAFYNFLESENFGREQIEVLYMDLQRDNHELPLKAELLRAYFHYMYRNYVPWDLTLKQKLSQLTQYANEELYLETTNYPIEMAHVDETTIRLRIIYDIAPCILDSMNDTEQFKHLYELSVQLSKNIQRSYSDKSIAQYMENVFRRKAFLFVNQMQCSIYYDKAKKYFYTNQIWDEYCITLICEAGTDIVIQKYNDAIECCKKAKRIANQKGIIIPQPQKLMNNVLIADFFKYEQGHRPKQCFNHAEKVARKLLKHLHRIPCATEFVIVTNVCSLYLYADRISEYNIYKRYLEKLMDCNDVSDIKDEDIDDFYRYYFAWFEIYKNIKEGNWNQAKKISQNLKGFIPALFQKQEVFWNKKLLALNEIIDSQRKINGYDFCKKLVTLNRRASELATFFCRGLMLSDLQYTSYN